MPSDKDIVVEATEQKCEVCTDTETVRCFCDCHDAMHCWICIAKAHQPEGHLSDKDQALVFLYVTQVGVPKWAQSEGDRWQIPVLAKMMNWTQERAEAALDANIDAGHADENPADPLDARVISDED